MVADFMGLAGLSSLPPWEFYYIYTGRVSFVVLTGKDVKELRLKIFERQYKNTSIAKRSILPNG